MTSVAPDWTPATSRSGSASQRMRTNGDVGNQDFGTSPAGSQSLSWFRNALEALQKCPAAKFSTLLLVCLIATLTIGGMASDLLP